MGEPSTSCPRDQPSLVFLDNDAFQAPIAAADRAGPSILVYHRFGPAVTDAMTVRTATFRRQLAYLKEHERPIISLRTLTSYLQGDGPAPPAGAVVITADDGHESVFTEMLPVVREYHVPVTLFVYPSAISNASYAMTWTQLDALRRTASSTSSRIPTGIRTSRPRNAGYLPVPTEPS